VIHNLGQPQRPEVQLSLFFPLSPMWVIEMSQSFCYYKTNLSISVQRVMRRVINRLLYFLDNFSIMILWSYFIKQWYFSILIIISLFFILTWTNNILSITFLQWTNITFYEYDIRVFMKPKTYTPKYCLIIF
jgi:hypothetical protein